MLYYFIAAVTILLSVVMVYSALKKEKPDEPKREDAPAAAVPEADGDEKKRDA